MNLDEFDLNKDNLKIQPVLLGGDINCYSVARAFHEAYGVASIAFGRIELGATQDSKIIDFRINKNMDKADELIKTLIKLSKEIRKDEKVPILMGCTDEYAELIIDYRDTLSEIYITPYIDKELKDKLIEKESFYKMCEEKGLYYPKTYIFSKGDKITDFEFSYPVIIKPSDSVLYWQFPFEGMNKVYTAKDKDEFVEITNKIYSGKYDKNLIIQDFIPGDDSHMRVLTCYSDRNAKVKMMCLGHVLLEEHTPTGIGNHAAIITEYDEDLMNKIKRFLESINYVGFSNFDIKFDSRDNKYKLFEINLRQGRSNFYVTSSGNNIAKYVVEDRILKKDLELKLQKEPFYWHVVPNGVVFKYVKDEKLVKRVKKLISEGKEATSFGYNKDLSGNFKRSLYVFLYNLNHFKKYKKYLG
ncbi:carboxylate--amine ligase [Tissierella creatinophila]|uniref:D-aspartate ligase n=1 Tax=Tissierella creatinophila DSM 6911 TaxID=1123403 RepID=A0A1U7M6T3_TISCR|nr:carboxylate--amine ligase [Tissierella creatinophila]OLS03033.1 D-aspartate ligase [Tissierella creatinophila DSM 6911]